MRAPFQILAIPYKMKDSKLFFCVFHRSDIDQWQFIAGGGENNETPVQAAIREISEESGMTCQNLIQLKSMCYIPTNIFPKRHLCNWDDNTYVIPEYAFGFHCNGNITLSHEHTEFVWLTYEDAWKKLKWDSNRTALYELNCSLKAEIS